jgi:hypothetical protein
MMSNFRISLLGKTLSAAVLVVALLVVPSLMASSNNAPHPEYIKTDNDVVDHRAAAEAASIIAEAGMIYSSMGLEELGLPQTAFELAFRGYRHLQDEGKVSNNILTVADFSQSSRNKRLFILDVENQEVIMQTYVAHGRGSGAEYATSFSNTPESHKSSLGFYLTKNTYMGQHGLSLVLDGLERGINNNAEARKIVIHGANYVSGNHLQNNPFTGRSHGCPAVASKLSKNIIQTIKEGSVLFIYYPTNAYLNKSRILNG